MDEIHTTRLRRAAESLQGLSCGDAFGERFFVPDSVAMGLIQQRAIPAPPWFFTDDTVMALSILETLAEHREINQHSLAKSFAGRAVQIAAARLGNGSAVTAPDTVPFALWCAARHLSSYEEALWTTVSGLGDRDTTCAIVGGVVVMYVGAGSIPAEWLEHREQIPAWVSSF